jgi:cation diffusion facilitator CzcD-associated flavoprotein CzcO
VIGDETQMARIEQRCRMNLEHNIHDPELRARLTPDYKVACKRLIMSRPASTRRSSTPNAHLVTDGHSAKSNRSGVRTEDGVLHELDVLVLATGFDGRSGSCGDIHRARSQGGVKLDDAWARSPAGPPVASRCPASPISSC